MKRKLLYLWRIFTFIALFLGAYWAGIQGATWEIVIWFVWAWGSYWLADQTGEDTTWAPIYGLAWGVFSIAYYSIIYFRNHD